MEKPPPPASQDCDAQIITLSRSSMTRVAFALRKMERCVISRNLSYISS